MKSNIELQNHPQQPSPALPPSFSLLPDDIVLNCLARISKTHYPKLTLVSKSFRSLVLSKMLYKVRAQLKTQEQCVYLSLESPFDHSLIWFGLWIKPDRQCTTQEKSTGYLLVPVPSPYFVNPPNIIYLRVGAELYKFGSEDSLSSSSVMSRGVSGKWRDAPSMNVARRDPLVCVLHGKIYVMGGCEDNLREYWGEVFNPTTQTWKPLPYPGSLVLCSFCIKLLPRSGKIYMKTNTKNFVYLVKENKWEFFEGHLEESFCVIENVRYSYVHKKCSWYETKSKKWRPIKGLEGLDAYTRDDTAICAYGGKLVIFWDSPPSPPFDRTKKIWCAVILLDKSLDGEVWGQIEWVDRVLKVPPLESMRMRHIHSCVVRTC